MLKNKIRSKAGATILIALVFFLLCAMAGSVILAAGSGAAGRIAGLKEQDQAYYTVTSAAQLLRDEIKDEQFVYYKRVQDMGNTIVEQGYLAEPSGDLRELLKTSAMNIFQGSKSYTTNLTIYPAEKSIQETISQVDGIFTMREDYSIEIKLSLSDPDRKDLYNCKLVLSANNPQLKITTGIETVQGVRGSYTRTEVALTWDEAYIEKN